MKPWERLLFNLADLFTVKAIISLVIVFIFVYKVFCGVEMRVEFYGIFMSVVVYWLCEKAKNRRDEDNEQKKSDMP